VSPFVPSCSFAAGSSRSIISTSLSESLSSIAGIGRGASSASLKIFSSPNKMLNNLLNFVMCACSVRIDSRACSARTRILLLLNVRVRAGWETNSEGWLSGINSSTELASEMGMRYLSS
jgi:hypothetical protein